MVQSGRLCPTVFSALFTRCMRRSAFVNVPSFSAHEHAGKTTSASCAVGVRNMS